MQVLYISKERIEKINKCYVSFSSFLGFSSRFLSGKGLKFVVIPNLNLDEFNNSFYRNPEIRINSKIIFRKISATPIVVKTNKQISFKHRRKHSFQIILPSKNRVREYVSLFV